MSPERPAASQPICDYEGSDYQTSFWEGGERAYEDQVEAVALGRLLPPAGDVLLELGAGAGRNTLRYRGFGRIVLLDYSRSQLRQAQERLGGGDRFVFVAADVYRLPFIEGLFDAATMIRTLHHMAAPWEALGQIRGVMRPQGIFILEFANKQNLKAILRYLFRRQSWSPFSHQPVEFAPLNFDFHPAAVRAWLTTAGFRLERQLSVSHFRVSLLKRALPLKLLVWLDSLAQLTGGWWQLSPSVFVRAAATDAGPVAPPGAFFRCPDCHQPLSEADKFLPWSFAPPAEMKEKLASSCPGCGRAWSFEEGIFLFK